MRHVKYFILSAAVLQTASLATICRAQTPNTITSSEPGFEEVLVTGTSLSRQKALEAKKNASQVLEALSTDELGQLPDKNIGESLNRVPGVSMLVEKGEGRFVQIRGIQPALNNVTINGISLGSPEADDGGRAAPMDVVSGSLLGGVQVVKTPTADMDAQGIGGTVNIDVKKPFDTPVDLYGYTTLRYGFEELEPKNKAYGGHDPYSIDALISGKNSDKTFGWLLGGSFSSREYVAQGIYQDDWAPIADNASFALPQEVKNNYYIIGRERSNLSAVLEFKPTQTDTYFVRGFWANWDEYQHRNRYQEALTQDITVLDSVTGTSGPDRISANIRLESPKKNLFTLAAGGENKTEEALFDYLLQYNKNTLDEPYSYWEFRSGRDFGPNSWRVANNGIVTITPDQGTPDRQNPSLIDFRRARFQERDMTENALVGQINFKWNYGGANYVKTGIKFTSTDRDNNYDLSRYDDAGQGLTLGTDPAFTNGAFTNDVEAGDVANIWMNVDAMNRFFNNSSNANYFEFNDGDTFAGSYASDYELTENIYAAFAMGSWQFNSTEIIGGLRAEATDIDSAGYIRKPDSTAEKINAKGDYVNWLPSLLLNQKFGKATMLRAAITRGLGRPDYDSIAPRSVYQEETGTGDLSIGNPKLKPRESWNFDVSMEWYPNDLTLLSASVFYKDISNEIVSRSESFEGQAAIGSALRELGLSGTIDSSILDQLTVSTLENGESSELQGIELNAQTQFTMLPSPLDGLGASISATYIDAEVEIERNDSKEKLPLPGQAETSYNLSLFYQKGSIDAALSYAYNDSFLTDINGSREEDLDQGEFGRWDFKLAWAARDKLKVFFEAVNLNNEPTTEFQGGINKQNTEYEYVGRSVYLGVSYGF